MISSDDFQLAYSRDGIDFFYIPFANAEQKLEWYLQENPFVEHLDLIELDNRLNDIQVCTMCWTLQKIGDFKAVIRSSDNELFIDCPEENCSGSHIHYFDPTEDDLKEQSKRYNELTNRDWKDSLNS